MFVKVERVKDLQFRAENEHGLTTTMDASVEHGGGAGITPMENLLAALGGCSGMDVVAILEAKKQPLSAYSINISAERAQEHPKVFTRIDVEHLLQGQGLDAAVVQQAVESSTNRFCSVIAMLRETAEIHVAFRIVDE